MTFKQKLEEYRDNNCYTNDQTAEKLGISVNTLKKWLYFDFEPSRRLKIKVESVIDGKKLPTN